MFQVLQELQDCCQMLLKLILQLGYVVRTQPIDFDHNQTNDMTTNIKSAIVRLDPPLFLL